MQDEYDQKWLEVGRDKLTDIFKILSFIHLSDPSKDEIEDFARTYGHFAFDGAKFLDDVLLPYAKTYEELVTGGYTCSSETDASEIETLRRLLWR